jgi:TetR/AcrR family transcriptional repressor of nem operon
MRYPPEHKSEVRKKIVKDASRRFRAKGLAGAGVSDVMNDAGLTHGGFYKHFKSKDVLLVESLAEGFQEISDRLIQAAEQAEPGDAWKEIVNTYLSTDHCDEPESGCPLTALAPELGRTGPALEPQILGELVKYKSRMLPFMPGNDPQDKEKAFFAIFSTMIGAIELARMLPEPEMREKVIATARDFLLRSF